MRTPSRTPTQFTATIVRFADGDTLVALIKLGWGVWVERYIRLTGIDSWEDDDAGAANVRRARNILNDRFGGSPCLLTCHIKGHDRYGRVRGQVSVGGLDLAAEIVTMKLAWFIDKQPSQQPPSSPAHTGQAAPSYATARATSPSQAPTASPATSASAEPPHSQDTPSPPP